MNLPEVKNSTDANEEINFDGWQRSSTTATLPVGLRDDRRCVVVYGFFADEFELLKETLKTKCQGNIEKEVRLPRCNWAFLRWDSIRAANMSIQLSGSQVLPGQYIRIDHATPQEFQTADGRVSLVDGNPGGGRSVVFAMPSASTSRRISDLQRDLMDTRASAAALVTQPPAATEPDAATFHQPETHVAVRRLCLNPNCSVSTGSGISAWLIATYFKPICESM